MTPIKPGTAKRLGLRYPPTLADFTAVVDSCIDTMRAEFDPELLALLDAEREAAAEVMAEHRRKLDTLAARADRYRVRFADAYRHL